MFELLPLLLAAAQDTRVDAREHWRLHRALRAFDDRRGQMGSVGFAGVEPLSFRPDADVGLRVTGVTEALWDLIGSNTLMIAEDGDQSWVTLSADATPRVRAQLMRCETELVAALHDAAGCLSAAANTDSKKRRLSVTS